MIFFTQNIAQFIASNNMKVSPIPCELTDDRTGYFLGSDWKAEIEAKGIIVEQITKEQIKSSDRAAIETNINNQYTIY